MLHNLVAEWIRFWMAEDDASIKKDLLKYTGLFSESKSDCHHLVRLREQLKRELFN